VRPPAPLRQDLRAEDRRSDRHHLPAVQLDDDLLPGRHSRSGSSTTALHAPPPAATLRLTRQPWRAALIDSPMAPRSTPSHAAAGSSGCAWRGATTNLDSHPRCKMPGDHRSRTARPTPEHNPLRWGRRDVHGAERAARSDSLLGRNVNGPDVMPPIGGVFRPIPVHTCCLDPTRLREGLPGPAVLVARHNRGLAAPLCTLGTARRQPPSAARP